MKSLLSRIFVAALFASSTSCSITPRTPQGLDLTSLPNVLHYRIVSYPMVDVTTFDLEDGWIMKRISRWDRKTVTLARRRPSPEEWMDFNRFIARVRIWEWKGDYRREDIKTSVFDSVCDGESWAFSIHVNRHHVESIGNNAYPRWKDPKITTNDDKSIGRLTEAFERLAGPNSGSRKRGSEQVMHVNRP